MRVFRILALFFGGVLFFGSEVYAIKPIDTGVQALWSGSDISLSNPRTHGEFKPRLFGSLSHTKLRLGQHTGHWFALAHERGATHLWGSPILAWKDHINLKQMSQVLQQVVEDNPLLFGVRSKDLRLDRDRTAFSGAHRYVTFQRFFRGFPVEGAFLTFRFKNNLLIQITNHTFGEIPSVEAPTWGPRDALETVYFDSGFNETEDEILGQVLPYLQPFYLSNGAVDFRFVYKVRLMKSFPQGLYEYSVSARNGDVVRIRNELHTAGQVGGELFPRLPSDGIDLFPLANLKIEGAQRERAVTNQEGLFRLGSPQVRASLQGLFATVNDTSLRPQILGRSNELLLFDARENLSENMAYFHVNKVNRFVAQFIDGGFLREPLQVNTRVEHPIIKSCNAWFDPQRLSLNFLEPDERCEGSARIADVIYHEWGHFLDHAIGGIQDPAFSEAIGDVMALMMTGDPQVAPGFIRETGAAIRNISELKVYPQDRSKSPHAEGLIVGGAWFETFQSFINHYGWQEGRHKFAGIFLKHLVGADSYLDSYWAALVVDDDDGNLNNCTPHFCLINEAFARRGLTPADVRCHTDDHPLPVCAHSTILR